MNVLSVDDLLDFSCESSPSLVNLDAEVVNFGKEDHGDARPLKLIRTEVTEQRMEGRNTKQMIP